MGKYIYSSHPHSCPKLWIMCLSVINNLIYRNCKVWPCCKFLQTIFVRQKSFISGLPKDNFESKFTCFLFRSFFLGKWGLGSVTNPSHPHSWPKLWIMWLSLINRLIHNNCKVWPYRKLLQMINVHKRYFISGLPKDNFQSKSRGFLFNNFFSVEMWIGKCN